MTMTKFSRIKKDGTPLTDKGGTQKFTRVRAVKENGIWGRYRKGDNGKYEFEQLPSGVHPHPECDRYFKVFNLSLIEGVPPLPVPDLAPNDDIEVGLLAAASQALQGDRADLVNMRDENAIGA